MLAQVICKFQKDPIKNERTMPRTKYDLFKQSRANNSKVAGLIRPEFKLVLDSIHVLVTCTFDNDPINNERASV